MGLRKFGCASLMIACGICAFSAAAQQNYLYRVQPGSADVDTGNDRIRLENSMFVASWPIAGGKLGAGSFGAKSGGTSSIPKSLGEAFEFVFADRKSVKASAMRIVEAPRVETLASDERASRLEEHFAGKRVQLRLEDPASKIAAVWSAELRDSDNYVREEVALSSPAEVAIREVILFDLQLLTPRLAGSVKGSPVTAGDLFLGFEHPLSQCTVERERVRCSIQRELPLKAGQAIRYSSVIGLSPRGQMRRGFLNYVERERAHRYRPFLHYNSWFDIGFGERYGQAAALDAINALGEELSVKRGTKLDSFLFDDGWDDTHSLWSFDSGFPDGFAAVKQAAAKYGSAPGIWLSPWGGYDKAKEERMKYGKKQGFEMNQGGFALSGPKYFTRFREVTLDMIHKYGINQFKIDGTGNVNSVFPGSDFDSDFHAAISLMSEWRAVKPDIFVNLTTGTYPSPFWLRYADSIWRGGDDSNFAGVGPWREKWITYRDAATYAGIVQKGPLFPLNSLMLHGIIYAKQAEHLSDDPSRAFDHEVRSYFGSGTQLQELYVTHSLLTGDDWDALAEAAKWSRENAATLADTHWIGGDPEKLDVYGWAAWSPEKGIITLRNPSDHPQTFLLDVGKVFELPTGAAREYSARSPWKGDTKKPAITLKVGKACKIQLQPFEVLNLAAIPVH